MATVEILEALNSCSVGKGRGKRAATERALKQYAPLIKYVVDRIAVSLPKSVDREDLLSAAFIGLLDALQKYDPTKGTKFETYAVWRIRGAVLDELRSQDWISRSTRRKARRVEETWSQLNQRLGRCASEAEIAEELNLSSQDFSKLLDEVKATVLLPLHNPMSVDDDCEVAGLIDILGDESGHDPLEEMEIEEAKQCLLEAINDLGEQERAVIGLYYYEEMTLKEIGEVLQISESRVSQVHTRALLKLRGRVRRALYEEPPAPIRKVAGVM
jgi:RNA polymerase sigma factor for flagellar operon FliA